MKNLALLLVALFLLQLTTFAQTEWFKYAGNPVLENGAPGEWDAAHVNQQNVLWDGTKYKLWYTGTDGVVPAIGYATSPDGLIWTKDILNNPVLERGAPGSWDADAVFSGPVLFDGTLYKMWYDASGGGVIGIGLATSLDGINWTKDTLNNPVLTSTPGSWDAYAVWGAHVIYENPIYKMWYNGARSYPDFGPNIVIYRLGYAESDNGITWTKRAEPIMEEGDYVTWANDLYNPCVINDGNNYMMWYSSINTLAGSGEKINYATSPDGLDWTKFNDNPVLSPGIPPAWDYGSIWQPKIIKENNLYKMWYSGINSQDRRIGYAEDFSNLVHADSVFIEETYVKPNTDPLNILGRVISPEGHALTAKAIIVSDDGITQDSVELFDDGLNGDGTSGDGIYGGYWPIADEKNYTVGIKTIDLVTGFSRNGLDWNIIDRFTSKGEIKFEGLEITSTDTIVTAGNRIKFKLTLKNHGLTDTVHNVDANLILYDYPIDNTGFGDPTFGDIAAGESLTNSGSDFALTVRDSASPGSYEIGVAISSNVDTFWYDSFPFIVVVTGVEDELSTLPKQYALEQNYPNPFNPTTTIKYQIPELSFVTLKVYDVLGNEISTIVNEEKPAGEYEIDFDGTELTSGIYFNRLQSGNYIETKKMVLLR